MLLRTIPLSVSIFMLAACSEEALPRGWVTSFAALLAP